MVRRFLSMLQPMHEAETIVEMVVVTLIMTGVAIAIVWIAWVGVVR